MSLLDRKLWRDMTALRGQVVSIALVVAAGVAVFVASISTYDSLLLGRDRFYAETRFPQVFVTVKRAPLSIVSQLEAIPGVAAVEPRIVRDVIVDWPSALLPVSARMVSLTHAGDEPLARLHLGRGAAPAPDDSRGAVINEAFAEVNGVDARQDIRVILNGRLQTFHITGVALSSEYVYAVKPGVPIPDDRFFAVSVGRPQRGGGRLRHEGRLQRPRRFARARRRCQARHRRARPPARALWFGRRHRAARPAVQPVPRGRTQPAEGDVDHDSVHLLRRCRLPAQCRARPPGGGAARTDRRAQGARLSHRAARAALPQAGGGDRAVRFRARPRRRHRLRPCDDRELSGLLPPAGARLRTDAVVGDRRHGDQLRRGVARRGHRVAQGRRASRRPSPCGRRRRCAFAAPGWKACGRSGC